jgi:chromosome partitioning protein
MNLAIFNTHGATGKTATTLGLARALAEDGQRVLIVDLDPNFGATATLGIASKAALHDFLFRDLALMSCLTSVRRNLDILCSGNATLVAEQRLQREPSAQLIFEHAFSGGAAKNFDSILFDVGAGLSRLQVAAVCYSRTMLVPVTMNVLGVLGAASAVIFAQTLRLLYATDAEIIGFVPIMLKRDTEEKEVVMRTMSSIAKSSQQKLLPAIEYDESVPLAARSREFVADFSPGSAAAKSYSALAKVLMDCFVAES